MDPFIRYGKKYKCTFIILSVPFRAMGSSILMCKNSEIPFIYYDLETCNITHFAVGERSTFANHSVPIPAKNQFNNIIMYKNSFPLTPSMNSFNDVIAFPTTWFQSLQGLGM